MTSPLLLETEGAHPIEVRSAEAMGELIAEAAEAGFGLVPRSSTGRARLGRAVALAGTRLADLSALRAVPLVSARQRVAIVEAGVTYAQLQPLLEAEGLRLDHPLLPPVGKSVVASVMDRAPTLVPRCSWDFTDPLLCAELWFGTGDRFRTGSAAGPGATLEEQWRAGMFQKNPLGPAQTDLVKLAQGAQGAFGIATWTSVRLERAPELRRHFRVSGSELGRVASFVSAATRRRLGDEMIVLDPRQATALGEALAIDTKIPEHPWSLLLTVGSLPRLAPGSLRMQVSQLTELAATAGIEMVALDGTAEEELAIRLAGIPGPDDFANGQGDWKRCATGESKEISFLTTLNRAEPLVEAVRSCWSPIVGQERVAAYLQPLNQGRTCHVEVTAFVEPGQAERIDEEYARLVDDLIDRGAFFSRPFGAAVDPVYRRCADVVRTLHRVKAVVDPHGVLSPGVLCFDSAVAAAALQEVSPS